MNYGRLTSVVGKVCKEWKERAAGFPRSIDVIRKQFLLLTLLQMMSMHLLFDAEMMAMHVFDDSSFLKFRSFHSFALCRYLDFPWSRWTSSEDVTLDAHLRADGLPLRPRGKSQPNKVWCYQCGAFVRKDRM